MNKKKGDQRKIIYKKKFDQKLRLKIREIEDDQIWRNFKSFKLKIKNENEFLI